MSGRVTPVPYLLADDGVVPNSALPLLVYASALPSGSGPTAFEDLFAAHAWTGAWRNGIYPSPHYHSTSHEVLGIYRGQAQVRFGGESGVVLDVAAGDVVVIPAGVAHQRVSATAALGVVGAYPKGCSWDLCRCAPGERPAADRAIAAVPLPPCDPLYGPGGPLVALWAPVARP